VADNTLFQASLDPAQPRIADLEVTNSGDLAKVQIITLAEITGSEGSYTLRRLSGLDTLIQSLLTLQGPATATAVASGTADAQVVAATTSLRLVGFSAKENAGSPANAEFILRHGTSTAGTPLAFVKLGPNESVRDWFGPGGKIASSGVFLDRVSGTTEVVVHTVVAP
jgi:hypothetical protein